MISDKAREAILRWAKTQTSRPAVTQEAVGISACLVRLGVTDEQLERLEACRPAYAAPAGWMRSFYDALLEGLPAGTWLEVHEETLADVEALDLPTLTRTTVFSLNAMTCAYRETMGHLRLRKGYTREGAQRSTVDIVRLAQAFCVQTGGIRRGALIQAVSSILRGVVTKQRKGDEDD